MWMTMYLPPQRIAWILLVYCWGSTDSSPWKLTCAAWVRPRTTFPPFPRHPNLGWSQGKKWCAFPSSAIGHDIHDADDEYSNFWSVQKCFDMYNLQSDDGVQKETSGLRFVDGTWYHKGKRNGRVDYLSGPRIPGSVFFDICDIAMNKEIFPHQNPQGLSHMQPPPELFAAYMDAVQISSSDDIVIYASSTDCAFLSRVWFTFRHVMGHGKVFLMHGSLQDWIDIGGPVDARLLVSSDIPQSKDFILYDDLSKYNYQVSYNPSFLLKHHDVKTIVATLNTTNLSSSISPSNVILVDTRGSSFANEGHIPFAIHVPYSSFHQLNQPLLFHSKYTLRALLIKLGLLLSEGTDQDDVGSSDSTGPTNLQNLAKPLTIALSCGSGVSVCNFVLALDECGCLRSSDAPPNVRVYDGSWEEWRALPHAPKVFPNES
jgi:thiosulfate/3-mercaptopyruvate sulfurtransferase